MKKGNRFLLKQHKLNGLKKDAYLRELYELEQEKMKIVKKIISYRIKHKITQSQMAKEVGITQQYISKIENGDFSNMETVLKLLVKIGYAVKIRVIPLKASGVSSYERTKA